jgi:peptide/nickel transport system substrate-binding protein
MAQRRLRPEGWNIYAIGAIGLQTLDPAVNTYLRGDGRPFGFTQSPDIERLREEWMAAPDLPSQQAKARALQEKALQDVPYIPIGQYLVQTASQQYPPEREGDVGVLECRAPLNWSPRRASRGLGRLNSSPVGSSPMW